jgi:hypothetical protein
MEGSGRGLILGSVSACVEGSRKTMKGRCVRDSNRAPSEASLLQPACSVNSTRLLAR